LIGCLIIYVKNKLFGSVKNRMNICTNPIVKLRCRCWMVGTSVLWSACTGFYSWSRDHYSDSYFSWFSSLH
jgi:hypothetical protein